MADAPQVAYAQSELEVDQIHEQPHTAYQYVDAAWSSPSLSPLPNKAAVIRYEEGDGALPQKASKILGLRRRTFWVVLVLVVVLISGTIGGSVGGALAVHNSRYVRGL
jgi:hypothetical protein